MFFFFFITDLVAITDSCFDSREGLEDPLDDLGMVHQQLEQLSVIGRCEYQKTCALLVTLFDQAAQLYQELISTPTSVQIDISIQEGSGPIVLAPFLKC